MYFECALSDGRLARVEVPSGSKTGSVDAVCNAVADKGTFSKLSAEEYSLAASLLVGAIALAGCWISKRRKSRANTYAANTVHG